MPIVKADRLTRISARCSARALAREYGLDTVLDLA